MKTRGSWPFAGALAAAVLLAGCSGPRYTLPPRAYEDPALGGVAGRQEPDYYVLAWSEMNVSGRRAPTCPYEVVQEVQARAAALDRSDSWEQDKELASARPPVPEEAYGRSGRVRDTDYSRQDLAFPARQESKLLDLLRQKARQLGGDAVIDVVIHRVEESGTGLTVQNVEIAGSDGIRKITGTVIKFTDPECRR